MSLEIKLSQQEVQANADKISKLDLQQEDKALLIASLYMTNNRVEEATKILQNLINNGNQNKGVYRILGDIYCCSEQHELAQSFYRQVLNLSENSPPCIERLAANAGLAMIEVRNKLAVETKQLHQDIENEFNTLASDRQESAIEAAIKNLSSRDMQLAEFLTSLTTDCLIKGCSYTGEVVKSHARASCITCIIG